MPYFVLNWQEIFGIRQRMRCFGVPLFAQSVLRFTATQTGWLLAPGALASAIVMVILGKISTKVAARILIATRQLGGSIGIAILTTLLTQREAFHKAMLLTNLSPYDPETTQRFNALTSTFQSRGADVVTAHQQALVALEQLVNTQAAVLSYADVFRFVGIVF